MPLAFKTRLDFQVDRDFIGEIIFAPDINLELIDSLILTDNCLNRAWIDIRAANKLHVIPAPAYATIVDIPGAPARAGTCRNLHHHIFGAIADDWNKASSKRCNHPLTKFAIPDRLIAIGTQHLLDEMVFDDMRSARLMGTFKDHDSTEFGHTSGITALRPPGFLKLALDCWNRACRFA